MVKIKLGKRKEMYLDEFLKSNLDIIKETIKKDWDFCIVVDGLEGGGKSSIAQQIAKYLDPTLKLNRICFNENEFRSAILSIKGKYKAVIYDEAVGGLSSRSAMSKVNRMLISLMSQIRQKNLYVIIVIPCFFELDRYVAVWRSRCLVHTYLGDNFQRGFFSFYNIKKKKQLYFFGKKLYQYMVRPNFRGRFTKGYVVNEREYRKKKLLALEYDRDVDTSKTAMILEQRNSLIKYLRENFKLGYKQISEATFRYSENGLTENGVKDLFRARNRKVINMGNDVKSEYLGLEMPKECQNLLIENE